MGSCFNNQSVLKNYPNMKYQQSSTQSSSHQEFGIQVIPPSEIDANQNIARQFAKNPHKFFKEQDVSKCFKKKSLTQSAFNKRESLIEYNEKLSKTITF